MTPIQPKNPVTTATWCISVPVANEVFRDLFELEFENKRNSLVSSAISDLL